MQILSNVWPLRQVWDAQNPNFFFLKSTGHDKGFFYPISAERCRDDPRVGGITPN